MTERITSSGLINHDARDRHRMPELVQKSTNYFPNDSVSGTFIHRKASCAYGGGCPACKAKSSDPKISQPNDPAEIEVDQIADRVMRMSIDDTKPKPNLSHTPNAIHRRCASCEDEENEEMILRRPLLSSVGVPSQSQNHVRRAINSSGRPLDLW